MSNPDKQSTPKQPTKLETSDFLAFSDNQQFIEFCPTNSSSPQKQWKQPNRNNHQKGWQHQNRRFSGNYRNHSYNNMEKPHNRSFHGPYESYQQRYSFNRSYNSNTSNNSSRNDNYNSPKHNSARGKDIYNYLHPSFMEDPWEALEKDRMNNESSFIDNEELKESSSNSVEELSIQT